MMNATQLQARLQHAQSLQQAGRIDEAWRTIAPLKASIANDGQALRLYALIAQAAGEVDPASDALRRIILIEREPPEIVGALADMLGKAGRHDQALAQWTRLTTLLPTVADAHLNRVIAADQAGKHDIAIAAADAALKRFPRHSRLLSAKAVSLKNAGRIDESITLFEQAVIADPNRALTATIRPSRCGRLVGSTKPARPMQQLNGWARVGRISTPTGPLRRLRRAR